MGLLAVFFFWIFGLLTGVSLGAHTPWYAVLGIIAFAVSWVLMRISADAVSTARSWVREWQTSTVAFAASSSSAIGLPTMLLRPITTHFLPSTGMS